ncbi:MAG: (2Fe-2S)-binding protein [Methylomarinum sp.]|nr:(2Fe-2S)-binding protein [Methylomarinum sp.]
MNNTNQDQQKDIICPCSGTTTTKIKQLIDKGVDKISSATGACTGCGSCDASVIELIAEHSSVGIN